MWKSKFSNALKLETYWWPDRKCPRVENSASDLIVTGRNQSVKHVLKNDLQVMWNLSLDLHPSLLNISPCTCKYSKIQKYLKSQTLLVKPLGRAHLKAKVFGKEVSTTRDWWVAGRMGGGKEQSIGILRDSCVCVCTRVRVCMCAYVCPAPNIFMPTDLSSIQAGKPQLPTKNQNSCHRSSRRKLFLIMTHWRCFENLKISSVSRSLRGKREGTVYVMSK